MECKVNGCKDGAKKRGWCEFHYGRWRAHGDPLGGGPRRLRHGSQSTCKAKGCRKIAVSLHYCLNHYTKFKRYGNTDGQYVQDGRSKEWGPNKDGYIFRFDPTSLYAGRNKLVYQHRKVMGEIIGRPLRAEESVHHLNGNRADNRPENLELWIKGQPAGQRVQDQVAWARKVLLEYGDLVDRMRS